MHSSLSLLCADDEASERTGSREARLEQESETAHPLRSSTTWTPKKWKRSGPVIGMTGIHVCSLNVVSTVDVTARSASATKGWPGEYASNLHRGGREGSTMDDTLQWRRYSTCNPVGGHMD